MDSERKSTLSLQGKDLLNKYCNDKKPSETTIDGLSIPPPPIGTPRDSKLVGLSPPPPPPYSPNFANLYLDGSIVPPPPLSPESSNIHFDSSMNNNEDLLEEGKINGKVGRATAAAIKIRNLRKKEVKQAPISTNKTYNISNEYVNEAVGDSNPFAEKAIDKLSPDQFGVAVENALITPKSIRESLKVFGSISKSDVLIVGAALRTGAATVSKMVDAILNKSDNSIDVNRRVPWIESKLTNEDQTLFNEIISKDPAKKRAFLTYFSCGSVQSNVLSHKKLTDAPKIIVVVRHPLDARLSYFRFVRRLYKKCKNGANNKVSFDDFLVADDFARIRLAPISSTSAAGAGADNSYESNLCQWMFLQAQYKDLIHFAFYEDLLYNTSKFFDKIASVVGKDVSHSEKMEILERFTTEDFRFPLGSANISSDIGFAARNRGCSNKGHKKLCALSVANIDVQWTRVVARSFPGVVSFETFYSKMREAPFPLPPREYLDDAIDASIASAPPPSRRGHSRNASSSTNGVRGDSGFEMLVGNNEALAREIAKRYPNSYAARREVGVDKNNSDQANSASSKSGSQKIARSISKRFSLFSGLRRSSNKPSENEKQNDIKLNDTDTFSVDINGETEFGRSAGVSFSINEIVDSDDSDCE